MNPDVWFGTNADTNPDDTRRYSANRVGNEAILVGVVHEFDTGPTFVALGLTLIAIPSLMILLSTTLPARVNRAINLVVATLYIPVSMYNAAGESWTYSYFYGLSIGLEVLLLALILRYAWTWPRTAPSATMATKTTTTTSIS